MTPWVLRSRRCRRSAVLGILPGLLWAAALAGQDVSVRAYVNPSTVGVGRPFVLNVEVTGSQSLDREPGLPDLSAFATYLGSGSSTSMQIVNGRTTVSVTLQFRYQALEEGTFEIPAFPVTVNGEDHTTEPLALTISSAPAPEAPEGRTDPNSVAPEDLFLTAEATRSRVREGEPIVVEYRIFTRVDVTGFSFTTVPEPQGFWVEEIPVENPPQVEQTVRNGTQYTTAVIRRVALVPTGPGRRTLDPLGIEAQVRVRRRTADPFESFFDLDRSSLFGTVVPVTVLSNPIEVQVEPLPSGRPDPFSGIVGSLSLTATLDQDSVDANQAVTLTVTAQGRGNLRSIPEPDLDLPGDFEAYPPEISEEVRPAGSGLAGTKTWEYVLIPRAPGNRALPPVSMAYFDTDADAYRTVETEPLTLKVSGALPEGPSALVRGGVTTLREDIRFIHLGPAGLAPTGRSVFSGAGFWAILLLPMCVVLGAVGLRLHRDRLEQDPAFARRRRAGRIASARLRRARRLAGGDAPREFYAEVARALRGFVADKLDVPEAGMQMKDVMEHLRGRGVPGGLLEEVSACLDHCDRQRFAPPEREAGEEARFLDRVGKAMSDLNREVGR